jgi:protein involved in polysaccharide export with SLBB domain
VAVPSLEEYRLGPEDVLLIRVARHEEMGAEVSVLNDGRIMLPRIGELHVAERTPREVQELIVAGLKRTLVDPEVSVLVKIPRPRRIYVSGIVRKPGALPMQPGWRVSEALAEAGGLLAKPERTRATLFRRPDQTLRLDLARIFISQDPAANVALEPGDNLDVQEEPTTRVYVSGAVAKAGPVELPNGGSITEAIALAGGVSPLAASSRTVIQRLSGERVPVDMDGVLNHGQPAPEVELQNGDQIIIPENRQRVAVLGMVKRPGPFPMPDGKALTVAEAVSLAGGVEKRGRASRIGVIRVVDGQSTVTPVDLGKVLSKGSAEQNLVLQDGDIVYVPETDRPDWSKILPGAQAIGSLWYFLTR